MARLSCSSQCRWTGPHITLESSPAASVLSSGLFNLQAVNQTLNKQANRRTVLLESNCITAWSNSWSMIQHLLFWLLRLTNWMIIQGIVQESLPASSKYSRFYSWKAPDKHRAMCLSCVVLTPQRIALDETCFSEPQQPCIAWIDGADLGDAQEPRPRCGDVHHYLVTKNHGRKSSRWNCVSSGATVLFCLIDTINLSF